MVFTQQSDRLRAEALRRRWTIGLVVSRRCRQMVAALVGCEATGLAARVEVFAWRAQDLSREVRAAFRKLRRSGSPGDVAWLGAHLAESQAILLDDWSAELAPVWPRIMGVAVDGPSVGKRRTGMASRVTLGDSVRLAELSGHNVIDAFADRDLTLGGHGRPLTPVPYWMLLHDTRRTRVLLEIGQRARLWWLPAWRDGAGSQRVLRFDCEIPPDKPTGRQGLVDIVIEQWGRLPTMPRAEQLLVSAQQAQADALVAALPGKLPGVEVNALSQLRIAPPALRPAAVAVLGQLHLDQVPANLTALTGASTPRVLGRLTPGSPANWQRLVKELAAARPSVVSLRSAV